MMDFAARRAQPTHTSTTRARGAVTGHNVRYVLGWGLLGVIVAFVIVGLFFGIGSS